MLSKSKTSHKGKTVHVLHNLSEYELHAVSTHEGFVTHAFACIFFTFNKHCWCVFVWLYVFYSQ